MLISDAPGMGTRLLQHRGMGIHGSTRSLSWFHCSHHQCKSVWIGVRENYAIDLFELLYIYITILYIYVYNYTIYIWVRLEIPYPHWKVCLGGMLRRYASGFASGSASHELHHMELTSYLRGFQQTFQPFIYLCVYPCTHIYIYIETHMVFWSKSTAKGQSLAFPSTGEARG